VTCTYQGIFVLDPGVGGRFSANRSRTLDLRVAVVKSAQPRYTTSMISVQCVRYMSQYSAVLSMADREMDHNRTDIMSRNSVALS